MVDYKKNYLKYKFKYLQAKDLSKNKLKNKNFKGGSGEEILVSVLGISAIVAGLAYYKYVGNKNSYDDLEEIENDKLEEDTYNIDINIRDQLLKQYYAGLYEYTEILSVVKLISNLDDITIKRALEILEHKYTKIKKGDIVLILDTPSGNATYLAVVDNVNIGTPHSYNCTIIKQFENKDENLSRLIKNKQELFKLPKHKFFTKILDQLLRQYYVGLYEYTEILSVVKLISNLDDITINEAFQILAYKYTKIKKNDVVLILDNPNGNAISLAVVDKVNIGNPHTYTCTIVKPFEEDQNEDLFISINDKQKLFKLPEHQFFTKKGILFYLYSNISNGKNIEERYDKLFKCLDDYYKESKNTKNTLRPLEKCIEEIFDKSHVRNIQIDEVVDDDDEVVDNDKVVDDDSTVQDTTLALKYREVNENKNEEEFVVTFGDKVSIINIDEVLKLIDRYNVNIEARTDISAMDKMSDITVYKSLTLESKNNLLGMNRAYEEALGSISNAKKKLIQEKYYGIMNLKHLPQPSFLIETQYLEALYILIDECLLKLAFSFSNLKGAPNSNFMESLSESISTEDLAKFVEISEYILDDINRIKGFLNEIKSTLNDHKSGFTERVMVIEDESIYDSFELIDESQKNKLDKDEIESTQKSVLALPSNETDINVDYPLTITQDDIDDLNILFNNNPKVTNEHLDILFDIIHSCMKELEKNNDLDFSEIYSDYGNIELDEFSILNKLIPDTEMLKELKTEIISNKNKIKSFLKEILKKNNLDNGSSFMNKLRAYKIVVNAVKLTISYDNDGKVKDFVEFDDWKEWYNKRLREDNEKLDIPTTRLEVVNAAIQHNHEETNIQNLKKEQFVLIEKIKSFKKKLIEKEYIQTAFIKQKEFLSK